MQYMLNNIYVITTIFNGHRLSNAIRDLRLHFPDSDVQICIGVDRHNIYKDDEWNITTDSNHFGSITQIKLDDENKCGCGEHTNIWCAMSHMNVVKDALDKWYESILVIEDDLLLWTKARQNFNMYMDHLPDDWELLRLSRKPYDLSSLKEKNSCFYTGNARWCEMYMLNKNGIKKFYEFFRDHFMGSTDAQMWKADHMNIYIAKCPLGIQWNNYDIDSSDTKGNKIYNIKNSSQWWYIIEKKKSYLKLK
jgi:hypothetical protein